MQTDLASVTTVSGLHIVTPNTEITDDTPNATLSRVVSRIQAKGIVVLGIYSDGWQTSSNERYSATRTWEIDVAPAGSEDSIGSVIVREARTRFWEQKLHGKMHRGGGTVGVVIGFDKPEVANALGWREAE